MEFLAVLSIFLVILLVIILQGYLESKKKEKDFFDKVKSNYGKESNKKYSLERFERVRCYYDRHKEPNSIDDITWNDLELDDIFKKIDYTYSSCGEEYLYYKLRTLCKDSKELEAFEGIVKLLSTDEKKRVDIIKESTRIGYVSKYSIYEYLDNLDNIELKDAKMDIALNFLFIPLIAMLPFVTSLSIILLLVLTVYNIISYFKKKGKIETYVISFSYILRLITHARNILEIDFDDNISQMREECKSCVDKLIKLKIGYSIFNLGSFSIGGSGAIGGNPLDIIIDYFKILFHIDIIAFMKMKKTIVENLNEIDKVISYVGYIESCVSVAYYRQYIKEYCMPELISKEKEASEAISIKGIYHPLISEPVKNDLNIKSSMLITGSNASGKSTFIKSIAINAILAQTINTCLAEEFKIPICLVYSSMALKDNLKNGESYYIVETKALKRILDATYESDRKIFCFIDEVLRGTNTIERIAASAEVLQELAKRGAFVCAATHDYELAEILEGEFRNYHFAEEIVNDDILFSYRLMEGQAKSRNAIRLLKIMGFDNAVVERANIRAEHFLKTSKWQGQ